MDKVWAFWDGPKPAYIDLCMRTWNFDYTLLDRKSLQECMELPEGIDRFTLPQIADYIRVHILRDHGGYWLDTDTIVLGDELPDYNLLGYPKKRASTIGFLHTEPHSYMYECWADFQDKVVENPNSNTHWSALGNDFTNIYLLGHPEIKIGSVERCWPETYMFTGVSPRRVQYTQFYFNSNYHLSDLLPTKMLMLHNSWTAEEFKCLSTKEVLTKRCTLSNILREVL